MKKTPFLSLEEEAILDHKITDFSCVDLNIRTEEIGEGLKELSKTLINYPFSVFIGGFINLVKSYGILDSFLKFYKEKLKLGAFTTKQADNLLFKELIKYVSGNSEGIKTFCQYIKEIKKCNTPNKKHNSDEFFIMGKHKQNQLEKIYSCFKKLSEKEIKPKDVEYILKKLEALDEIFKTTDSNTKFTPKTEVKDIIKEIDENTLSMKNLNSNLEHSD